MRVYEAVESLKLVTVTIFESKTAIAIGDS